MQIFQSGTGFCSTLPLALAAHTGDMSALGRLMQSGEHSVHEYDAATGRTALALAVEAGHLAAVDFLVVQIQRSALQGSGMLPEMSRGLFR